jgi:hypothetical protein
LHRACEVMSEETREDMECEAFPLINTTPAT